jgi:adenosylhomocysteine nucleosidase
MNKTAGILFADTMEYGPFLQWAKEIGTTEADRRGNDSCEVTLIKGDRVLKIIGVRCGIGKVNAASATAFLIADDKVDLILNAGLSGAVQKLRREDMIAVESYVECDYDLTAIGKPLGVKADGQKYIYTADEKLMSYALESEGIIKAKAGTGDIFLTDKVKKELYRDTFGIDSFDMETAAIAGVCDKSGVPMLSLRKISDDADDASVEDYREMNNRQESCLTELLTNIFDRIIDDDSQW